MELILKKDNKTLEFVSGSQVLNTGDINLNDDFVQVITVKPETPLSERESLAIVFERDGMDEYTQPLTLLESEGKYTSVIPNGVLSTAGEWEITILRRRYKDTSKEGNFSQIASNTYSLTVEGGVKTSNGTPVTASMVQTLYNEVEEKASDAKNAATAAAASESNAKSYAESALEYRNEARAAAENAAAEATEKANKAAADAETAREAAVSAKDAAEMAQADAESAATVAATEAVREVNERINATDTKVNSLETDIAVLNNALMIGGITAKATTETAYNERITADGLNVLDGSKAKLEKVVGSTVKCNNLIPFPYSQTEKTVSGITFTVQYDGGVYIKGTATATATFAIYSNCKLFSAYVGAYANGTPAVKDGYCMSATAILKSGNAPKVAYENYSSTPNNGFVYLLVTAGEDYDCVVYPMVNVGETAEPYEKYFAGLKSASFAGIESTGRNLIPFPYANSTKTENGVSFTVQYDGGVYIKGTATATATFAIYSNCKLFSAYVGAYANGTPAVKDGYCMSATAILKSGNAPKVAYENYSSTPNNGFVYLLVTAGEDYDCVVYPMINAGSTALPYKPYTEPSVFNFPQTELGEWDSIDLEKQKVVRATKTIVFDGTENWELQSINDYGIANFLTHFNEPSINTNKSLCNFYTFSSSPIASTTKEGYLLGEGGLYVYFRTFGYTTVADWKAHLTELDASGNPLTIAYELATPTEETIASDNKYRAYSGGTENVLGNDNAEYVKNTLTQSYIVVKE